MNPVVAEEELRVLNAQFIQNFISNDVDAHDRLLHPAFSAVRGDGSVVGREQYLHDWATGFSAGTLPYWDTRGETITVIGDVALVRSTNRFVVRTGEQEVERFALYTDTYLLTAGRWQCIQAQTTPVQAGHVAPEGTIVSVYRDGVLQEFTPRAG